MRSCVLLKSYSLSWNPSTPTRSSPTKDESGARAGGCPSVWAGGEVGIEHVDPKAARDPLQEARGKWIRVVYPPQGEFRTTSPGRAFSPSVPLPPQESHRLVRLSTSLKAAPPGRIRLLPLAEHGSNARPPGQANHSLTHLGPRTSSPHNSGHSSMTSVSAPPAVGSPPALAAAIATAAPQSTGQVDDSGA